MGSYRTVSEAQRRLATIDDEFINEKVRPSCEKEMKRFWPEFNVKFSYSTWTGAVLAKIKTDREFRSAVTFQERDNRVIHVIPGKISNIFDIGNEILSLVGIERKRIITEKNYRYVAGGTLDYGAGELIEEPKDIARNTCELQTYEEQAVRSDKIKQVIDQTEVSKVTLFSSLSFSHEDENQEFSKSSFTV